MKDIQYWNAYSKSYGDMWHASEHKRILHKMEMKFISTYIHMHIKERSVRRYLDIGCGTGRVVAHITKTDKQHKPITAIDYSNAMIAISKAQTHGKKITYKQMDMHKLGSALPGKYSFATSIRVLKYSHDINAVIHSVSAKLDSGSIFVFTVTNKHSIAYFDSLQVAHYKTTASEIRKLLKNSNFRVLDIQGFQKIPELIYSLFDKIGHVEFVFAMDKFLKNLFGPVFFSRSLFVAARKI